MADSSLILRTAAILCLALSAAGCRDEAPTGALFEVSGKMVIFNYRVATATYLVTLRPLGPLEEGQTAVATFENPDGGAAIVVRQKVWPKLAFTTLESPPLRCIVKDRPYAATIRIEGPDGGTRQTIEVSLTSSLDQSVLPDRPLVVGPVYTPNPELVGRPGGKLDVTNEAGCPKQD
ncbi:MAG: hypothetical protein Q8Q62_00130 [Mesorhizobium sp.]|nr:hypothetical protein [Mesorhizobium sp.]